MRCIITTQCLAAILFVAYLWCTNQDEDEAVRSRQPIPQQVQPIKQFTQQKMISRREKGSEQRHQHNTIATTSKAYNVQELSQAERESIFFRVNMEPVLAKATKGGPMDYLPNYRSPCWESVLSKDNKCGMSCLPLVFLAGVTKSGTTDLYYKLIQHKHISKCVKEPMWWNRLSLKLYPNNRSFTRYVSGFNQPACHIQSGYNTENVFHPGITLDASSTNLWDYDGWEHIPGNKGLDEPKYILPSVLRVLIPQALYIVILRQPSERVYSNFRMRSPRHSVEFFHNRSVAAIDAFNGCLQEHSLRHCAYMKMVQNEHSLGLFYRASLYYVYLKDWLNIVQRKQMLILKSEDYYANRTRVLMEVFSFLKLEIPPPSELRSLESSKIVNQKKDKKGTITDPMLPKTRRLLDDFYSPYNDKLARFLNDDRFKWAQD